MERNKDSYSCSRKGFTLLETMLALAVTGLIFVGAMIGVGTNLSRQRFKDTVNQAVESIRSQYDLALRIHIQQRENDDLCSRVIPSATGGANITNSHRGRTDCNVYGTAFYIGADQGSRIQSTALIGEDLSSYRRRLLETGIPSGGAGSPLEETDYAGVDDFLMAQNDMQLMDLLNVSNIFSIAGEPDACSAAGVSYDTVLQWGGIFQTPEQANDERSVGRAKANSQYAKMIVLVVRSPRDGAVHTWVYDLNSDGSLTAGSQPHTKEFEMPDLRSITADCHISSFNGINIQRLLEMGKFKSEQVDLCINSEDSQADNQRLRHMRIQKDGASSTAVMLMDADNPEIEDICNSEGP